MKTIGVTMGDPAGIGPEVLLKALADGKPACSNPVLVFGDRGILERSARALGLPLTFPIDEVSRLDPAFPCGRFSVEGGRAQIAYLEAAAGALEGGQISALVTGPLHKRALRLCNVRGPGQTEWLGFRFGVERTVMMLYGPRLKVILATTHLPLREVAGTLDRAELVRTVETAAVDLQRFFFPKGPRLALAALNPHGEVDGEPGPEEQKILAPAVADLVALGWNVTGPIPADSLFAQAAAGRYDVVVALYHDQGLAPLKTLHFSEAVNVTLGLGRVRTAPDHGVAYDIAGKGAADPTSLKAAIRLAAEMIRREAGAPSCGSERR